MVGGENFPDAANQVAVGRESATKEERLGFLRNVVGLTYETRNRSVGPELAPMAPSYSLAWLVRVTSS